MLLTLSQSGKPDFGVRPPHELASPPPHSGLRYSPHRHLDHVLGGGPPNNYAMSTSHRGLPPPSAMTLPEPNRPQQQPPAPPPPPHQQPTLQSQPQMGALPAPPSQWQGGEDSMRHWLSTKAEEERTKQEEEKRRQEEERTRQESFKLEQRLVEQAMLRESMKGGIPPQMIPVIFAGIGGPGLVSASVEMLHHYAAQLQSSSQHVQATLDTSPEQSRETRMVNPPQPNPFAAPQQAPSAPSQPPAPLSQHQTTFSAYNTSNRAAPVGPTSAPRSVPASGLARINTIDLGQQSGPVQTHNSQGGPADQTSQSPSIYFHHWVPPATQETKGHPPTPIGRNEPSSAHPSHSGEAEWKDSPRKRKAIGGHGPLPPPSQTSPSFSSQSSTRSRGNSAGHTAGHMRSRSNKSNEDQSEASRRPPSRRDSVATQPRGPAEHPYAHDPHSRPPSHAGTRSPPMRREYMR